MNPEHRPRVAGCCGWFADLDEAQTTARARAYRVNVNLRDYAPWEHLVVGKVALTDVISYRPPPIMRQGGVEVEWQARYGTIVKLGILDAELSSTTASAYRELGARYKVPVCVYVDS